jgi:hypothetical protein
VTVTVGLTGNKSDLLSTPGKSFDLVSSDHLGRDFTRACDRLVARGMTRHASNVAR